LVYFQKKLDALTLGELLRGDEYIVGLHGLIG